MPENLTDVTLEVFNHCAGTCTGCMLSVQERRAIGPVMPIHRFRAAMDALARYGDETGLSYRALLTFGDIPWLPVPLQRLYYTSARDAGLPLGATMTMVEAEAMDRYRKGLETLLDIDPTAVFDLTVDPVRLQRDDAYAERLMVAISMAPELHVAMLLSEAVLTRNDPESLADIVSDRLGGRPILLGFTPALERMAGVNYAYDIGKAAGFARRFYGRRPEGRALLEADIERFTASGSYGDFIAQTFHVGPDLSIYPTGYTAFGDVALDARNGGTALGNLEDEDLGAILRGRKARRLSIEAEAWMDMGGFGCDTCEHRRSCTFNGVGAVRRLYADYEFRTGACYGPASLLVPDGVPA